jgi:hypothetical protein
LKEYHKKHPQFYWEVIWFRRESNYWYVIRDIFFLIEVRIDRLGIGFWILFHWTNNRIFIILKNTAFCTLRLLRIEDFESKFDIILWGCSFISIGHVDNFRIFKGIKFIDEYFLNKIFNVLAFLILIMISKVINLL